MIRKGSRQTQEWINKRVKSRSWYHPSEETKRKMSEVKSGTKNPFYGHHWNKKQRELILLSHLGKHHSKETKKKISLARINYYKNHPEAKPSGKRNPMYNKHPSNEMKLRLKKASTDFYTRNPEIIKNYKLNIKGKTTHFLENTILIKQKK